MYDDVFPGNNLVFNAIVGVRTDSEGNIIVGLDQASGGQFIKIRTGDTVPELSYKYSEITSFCIMPSGRVVASAVWLGYVTMYSDDSDVAYYQAICYESDRYSEAIRRVGCDADGMIWIVSYGSVYRQVPGPYGSDYIYFKQVSGVKERYPDFYASDLIATSGGMLITDDEGSVCLFWAKGQLEDLQCKDNSANFCEMSDGTIYCTASGNIYKRNMESWEYVPFVDNEEVSSIFIDSKDYIWALTLDGLYCRIDEQWVDYSLCVEAENWSGSGGYKIAEDADHSMFFISTKGYYEYTREQ